MQGRGGDGRPLNKDDNDPLLDGDDVEGDTANEQDKSKARVAGVDTSQLRAFVERIERLDEERRGLADDIKDIKAEAKSLGYDIPALNKILKDRRKDRDELDEFETIVDVYRRALDM